MKAERRRFMSGRTSDVHRAANPQQQQQQQQQKRQQSAQEAGTGPSRGDFLTMQREVQVFGELMADLMHFSYMALRSQSLSVCSCINLVLCWQVEFAGCALHQNGWRIILTARQARMFCHSLTPNMTTCTA